MKKRRRRYRRLKRLRKQAALLIPLGLLLVLIIKSTAKTDTEISTGEYAVRLNLGSATIAPVSPVIDEEAVVSVNPITNKESAVSTGSAISKETTTPTSSIASEEAVTPAPPTTFKTKKHKAEEQYLIWFGWTACESGEESWELAGSDGGHAYGRYQFDDRYCLADFFRFCVEEDASNYESFTTFYYVDGQGEAHIQNTERIAEEWSWICHLKGEAFYNMQTKFAMEYYYASAKQTMEQQAIDIDDYGPVLRGTIMSLAIRDGAYKPGLSSAITTYYDGISEQAWLEAIYDAETIKHPTQKTRWKVRQKNAALKALAGYNKGTLSLKELDIEPVQHSE